MKKLYVGNLPFSADESELESIFNQYGALESLTIVRDRDTGQPRGFAFVEYKDDAAAEAAGAMPRALGPQAAAASMPFCSMNATTSATPESVLRFVIT